ncbi:MAG: glycoside hydrolase family 5 protein [Butyrivibrio sp.]|nr:glycoside hydrolase family 5 protein [Butyrivibrio sp.]
MAVGASANDIGVIISTSSTITAFTYSGTTTNVASSGGSQGGSQGGSTSSSSPSTPVTPYEPPKLESGTPVGNHGALSVNGRDLVDKNGKKFQLKGVSTHGIQWFPQYVNKEAIKTLRDNWGANVFRIAMYTYDNGGYCNGGDKTELEALVSKGVEACTELGMYVIIDWHVLNERDPNVYKSEAKKFFDRMSKKYKNNVNVIYEICNEPNGPGWSDVKSYADEVISVIRNNDPDAIIIVGTPTWSQDVDQVADKPVAQPKNVMYALHFYAAEQAHKDNLRNKLKTAYAAGTPVFVSEFSICDASGDGGIDYESAKAWKELINSYNLSFVSWSLCNKNETSALLSSSTNKTSGWSDSELSEAGRWIRDFIAGK